MTKQRPNQVNVTFDEVTRKRVERCVERYRKRDKALVVYEIVNQYIGMYEQAEEAKFVTLMEQGALGKESAPATTTARRARKSA
jgi:hypothetical protein